MQEQSDTPFVKTIALWLFVCCAMVFMMVVIGGLTRLTGSGLSMVRWAPLLGWLPPMDEAAWQEVFGYYRNSPEFMKINWNMTLEGFKGIFWLEYIHRVLGRLSGVVFLLPFLYFLTRRRMGQTLVWHLALVFFLGGMQGVLGWFMVKSGLVDNPHVSQYRLTAHLGLALLLYAYMFWLALGLYFQPQASAQARAASHAMPEGHTLLKRLSVGLTGLLFLTILSGGFVAGLHAGLAFNTFPLMGGAWIPEDLLLLKPAYLNFFENLATVQWDHRLLATLVFLWVVAFWWVARRFVLPKSLRLAVHLLLGMVLLQLSLGIATLLWLVPIPLASAHQAGAVFLLTLALFITHRLRHVVQEA